MKVALFGGTGFVGTYIAKELLKNNHDPHLLVRPGSEYKVFQPEKCKVNIGDLKDFETIELTVKDSDAVIYNIGIIRQFPKKEITFEAIHFEGAKHCIDVAKKFGIKRFILMSANGVKYDGTVYQSTKFLADQYLKNTGLDWTIFRPSLIFGNPNGRQEFCSQLREDMLNLPLPAPLFFEGFNPWNAGQFAMSPIHVKDVASIFVKALVMEKTIGKIYELGGPESYNWIQLIDIISAASGKKKWKIPAPVTPIKLAASIFERFPFFPITKDQVTMLLEGNTCDSTSSFENFEVDPISFSSENLGYLAPK
jgi:NADH dehydrogenase